MSKATWFNWLLLMYKNPFLVNRVLQAAFMKFKIDRFFMNKLLFMLKQCVPKKSLSVLNHSFKKNNYTFHDCVIIISLSIADVMFWVILNCNFVNLWPSLYVCWWVIWFTTFKTSLSYKNTQFSFVNVPIWKSPAWMLSCKVWRDSIFWNP